MSGNQKYAYTTTEEAIHYFIQYGVAFGLDRDITWDTGMVFPDFMVWLQGNHNY